MHKPIGIAIDPRQFLRGTAGSPETPIEGTLYVLCDDGNVFTRLTSGARGGWRQLEAVPGTEAAEAQK